MSQMFMLIYQITLLQQSNTVEQTVVECWYTKHEGIALGSQKALLKNKHFDFFMFEISNAQFWTDTVERSRTQG